MKLTKNIILLTIIILTLSGCSSSLNPTPVRTIPKYNNTTPEYTAKVIDTLYHNGLFEHANSLMCKPNTENKMFKISEKAYNLTINKPYSVIIRMRMYKNENFSYYDDTIHDIKAQLFSIRQHYYFNYAKYYIQLKGERLNKKANIKNKIIKKQTTKEGKYILLMKTDFYGKNSNTTYIIKQKNKNRWCVENFF